LVDQRSDYIGSPPLAHLERKEYVATDIPDSHMNLEGGLTTMGTGLGRYSVR